MEKFDPTVLEENPSPETPPADQTNLKRQSADAGPGRVRVKLYREVPPQPDFPGIERRILVFWEETRALQRRIELNEGGKPWSFMDGPKTANNPIGVHHAWGRTLKDLFQRYRAMIGHELRYQNGFDCQGLWVEVEVEKELGFSSKRDIDVYGVSNFVTACKKRVLHYASRIVAQSKRLGQWMDWDDTELLEDLAGMLDLPNRVIALEGPRGPVRGTPDELVGMLGTPPLGGSYFTFSDGNNYAIWRLLKVCHERGWIYKGADVVPWCPRCSTALSEHELDTEGYREMSHVSPFVRFPVRNKSKEHLLVWTTTPWTLSSNVAIAANPELTYVRARLGNEVFYLAEGLLRACLGPEAKVLGKIRGVDLQGLEYEGLYDNLESVSDSGAGGSHRIVLWEQVSSEEGTGLVHIAPGCGREDFELGVNLGLPAIAPLDEFGVFVEGFGFLTGDSSDEASSQVLEDLDERGLLLRSEDYNHRYPICWRCETPVVFRLVDEWFIAMDRIPQDGDGTTLREALVRSAREVKWIPSFGLQRELDWLKNMGDWMISKKRYWGLALPIWECESCGSFDVIGDRAELKERAMDGWGDFEGHSPHRPWVDHIKVSCRECGAVAGRIPDVGNPWLDAGIVCYSTLGYFDDRDVWDKWFPVEFICESLRGQFRNWFYAMLTMSTILEGRAPFMVCLGHGDVRDDTGREMHSSLGNAIWFDEAVEDMGADLMRWMYCSTSTARDLRFSSKLADGVRRDFFLPLWNTYRFFTTYAELDRWRPGGAQTSLTEMDRWILSRLQGTIVAVTEGLEEYNSQKGTEALQGFVSDLSRWYLRGSRRRFWRNDADSDKEVAYFTLHRCLGDALLLMSPFAPFISEEIYQNLVGTVRKDAPTSVHHNSWPSVDESLLDEDLERAMGSARIAVELGRSLRSDAGIKLRQPLGSAVVVGNRDLLSRLKPLKSIIEGELNVACLHLVQRRKRGYTYVKNADLSVGIDLHVGEDLRIEGLARDIVRYIQNRRKEANLEVSERIITHYSGDHELVRVVEERSEYISRETLTEKLIRCESCGGHPHMIQGKEIWISLASVKR